MKTDTEKFLSEYQGFISEKRQLMNQLDALRRQYDTYEPEYRSGMTALKNKSEKTVTRPVEKAVIYLVDHINADIEETNNKIRPLTVSISCIDSLIMSAGLTTRERQYVRLRYLEGRSVTSISMMMGLSFAELTRTRKKALDKIEKARK